METAIADRRADDMLIDRLHALSERKRLRILALLRSGELCVCDLQDRAGLPQSLLSFHLKTLRDAGLVRVRRAGRWGYYSLSADSLAETAAALGDLADGRLQVAAASEERPANARSSAARIDNDKEGCC